MKEVDRFDKIEHEIGGNVTIKTKQGEYGYGKKYSGELNINHFLYQKPGIC